MFLMFLSDLAVNKNVVQINLNELVNEFKKHIVYILLSTDETVNKIKE